MSAGTFITIDGPSGVGKTTAAAATADVLAAAGRTVCATAEPSTSMIGVFTRTAADEVRGRALACLVAADRHDHLRTKIMPHLELGHTVVCDRYLASSLVLQPIDGVSEDFVLDINDGIEPPDLAVVLTGDPLVISDRLARRGARDRFELDPTNTAKEVELYERAVATMQAMGIPVLALEATSLTPSEIAGRISLAVEEAVYRVHNHG